MSSAISPSWISSNIRPEDHAASTANLRAQMPEMRAAQNRRDKSIFDPPVPVCAPHQDAKWPMDSYEQPPFPPPWPSKAVRDQMCAESADSDPEGPLGPLASAWVDDLMHWYERLQTHFGFDASDLAANVRSNAHKWRRRFSFLQREHSELFSSVMEAIEEGHKIPFESIPPKYFRKHNPPSLAKDKVRAWAAIKGDMAHGAIKPANIAIEGVPRCVCPVRTADKNDGSARFVHNTRHVNRHVNQRDTKCSLETLLRTRNMYIKNGYLIGSDYASGYHCVYIHPSHRTYLAFALHLSELTDEARIWLETNHPEAYYHKKRCFIFYYVALPFGLGTSCKVFNSIICALVSSWRRYESDGSPTRASSYIDDIAAVQRMFALAMRMSIRMVFEAASLGLSLKIKKCSFFPRRAMIILGTIVDLSTFMFRVSTRRANKIKASITDIENAVCSNHSAVPAKLIASFVGLIWSISSSCQRAAGVMTRNIISLLSAEMRMKLSSSSRSLKRILSTFWSGTVKWSDAANEQLRFWKSVDFTSLQAPISADVLGKSAELVFKYPAYLSASDTSILCQDASGSASGGGFLDRAGNLMRPAPELYLSQFSLAERLASSTLREILGILRCLVATERSSKAKIIFACDNLQSVRAIKYGSRIPSIQRVARDIFTWCLRNGKVCWPVWLPRTHTFIREADRRSRLIIPHDERSPPPVVARANAIARSVWGLPLSLTRRHRTGPRLWYKAGAYRLMRSVINRVRLVSICLSSGTPGPTM